MALLDESGWKSLFDDALSGAKGIGNAALATLKNEYAPRFAAATSAEEFADLRVNLEAEGLVEGIELETVAAETAVAVLKTAAAVAEKALIAA